MVKTIETKQNIVLLYGNRTKFSLLFEDYSANLHLKKYKLSAPWTAHQHICCIFINHITEQSLHWLLKTTYIYFFVLHLCVYNKLSGWTYKNHGFCLLFLQLNNSFQKSIHDYILKVFVFVFEYFPFSEYSYSYSYSYNLAVFVFVFKYFCPVFDPSLIYSLKKKS